MPLSDPRRQGRAGSVLGEGRRQVGGVRTWFAGVVHSPRRCRMKWWHLQWALTPWPLRGMPCTAVAGQM